MALHFRSTTGRSTRMSAQIHIYGNTSVLVGQDGGRWCVCVGVCLGGWGSDGGLGRA